MALRYLNVLNSAWMTFFLHFNNNEVYHFKGNKQMFLLYYRDQFKEKY